MPTAAIPSFLPEKLVPIHSLVPPLFVPLHVMQRRWRDFIAEIPDRIGGVGAEIQPSAAPRARTERIAAHSPDAVLSPASRYP